MAEYISRDAVIDLITRRYENPEICTAEINMIPAADVAPVVHARWIPFHSEVAGDIQYCSACKIGNAAKSDFCPHCGAMMDARRCSSRGIDKAPTVNVVEVVRCKDCRYAYRTDGPKEEYDCRKISAFAKFFQPDHFCAYGEREG